MPRRCPELERAAAWGRDKDTSGHFSGSQISCNSVDGNVSQTISLPCLFRKAQAIKSGSVCVCLARFGLSLTDRSCCYFALPGVWVCSHHRVCR